MVNIFVEGGGKGDNLKTACRKGFREFLNKAGFMGKKFRIWPCGSRGEARNNYVKALKNGEQAVLLLDSETDVALEQNGDHANWEPWIHLGWDKPHGAENKDCHLMVQVMETWFLADIESLKRSCGRNFDAVKLPKHKNIELIPKAEVFNAMKIASEGKFDKKANPEFSYIILSRIDPTLVSSKSPWARRFLDLLKIKMQTTN